jgi:hypothetical protein
VRLAASVPNRAEFGDLVRNQFAECHPPGREIEYRRGRVAAAAVIARRPDRGGRGHGVPPGPPVVGARRRPNVVDVRRRARPAPPAPRDGARASTRSASTTPRRWPSCWPTAAARWRCHPGHGRRPGPGHHARHGDLVDAGRPRASCRAPSWCRWAGTTARSRSSTTPPERWLSAASTGWSWPCRPPRRGAVPRPARGRRQRAAGGRLRRTPPGPRCGRRWRTHRRRSGEPGARSDGCLGSRVGASCEVGSPERAQTVVWAPELRVRAQLRVGARGVGTRVRRRLPDRLG